MRGTPVGAADGVDVLAACAERDPDVILLDLAMPRLGGQAFADAYRRGPGRAKIIVISGATNAGEEFAVAHEVGQLSIAALVFVRLLWRSRR